MQKIFFYKNKFIPNFFFYKWTFKENSKKKNDSEFERLNEETKYLKISEKYQKILRKKLFKKLNTENKVKYPNKYWEILLNRWVKFYVDTIIFRYFFIKKSIKKNKANFLYFKFKKKKVVPNTLWEFYQILVDEERDNYLSYKIACYIKKDYPNIRLYNKKNNFYFNFKKKPYEFKLLFYRLINSILNIFLDKKNPIIVSSYLPINKEIILKNATGKIFFWKPYFESKNIELLKLLDKKRPKIRSPLIKSKKKNILEKIILESVDEYLPSYYLENFDLVNKFVKTNVIIEQPKFIFTSNEFLFNEFFKFYTVECLKNKNTKYFIGQHGSKYGCIKEQLNTIEEQTSDSFITWGWKNNLKHKSIGVLSTLGKKKFNLPQKINKIYIVNQNLPDVVTVFNTSQEFRKNFNNILTFLKNIDKKFYDKIIFRIHYDDFENLKFYEDKIKMISKKIIIDNGKRNLLNLIKSNDLVIFTYYSSGFLEFLSLNKISYLFFEIKKNIYIKKFYKNFFKLKNKIIFEDPIYFADFINRLCKKNKLKSNIYADKNLINFKKQYANYINSIDEVKKEVLK